MKHLRQSPNLVSTCVKGAHFTWQSTVKGGRALGGALLRLLHLRAGGLTLYWCSAIFRYAKFVVALKRGSGWPYVVLYLKSCAVLLQQSVGGMRIENTRDLKSAVSRTRGLGLPRIICVQHRKALMSGDIWTFRLWLSLFGLYRVIEMPCKLKLETITKPSDMDANFLREWYGFLSAFWPLLVKVCWRGVKLTSNHIVMSSKPEKVTLWLPGRLDHENGLTYSERLAAVLLCDRNNPSLLNLKPRLLAILKGSPNTGGTRTPFFAKGKEATSTSIGAIFSDVQMWLEYPRHAFTDGLVALYPFLQEWLALVDDTVVTRLFDLGKKVITQVERTGGASSFPGFGRAQGLGKLGFKVEPAGKLRVFAMVDCVTQIVMKPVHNVLFNILGTIPQDGTFDQKRPAELLLRTVGPKGSYWSYDLSAATDRFPLLLQHATMAFLLGPRLAGLWVRLLTWREFAVPLPPRGTILPKGGAARAVMYGAGQPMGALTSWAIFSLTHHILVQFAAYKAYGKLEWFKLYALLGDDIVLADAKVAQVYLTLLRVIGVEVGLAKSLISHNGSFEFAKRTWIHGTEASWISLTALGAAKADHSVLESVLLTTGQRSVMETLRVAARLLGYGYRRLASLPAVLSTRSRLQGLMILLMRPGSPWSSSVKDWLLMVRPGEVMEVSEGVLRVIGERLWSRLVDGLKASCNAHLRGVSRVRLSDEYGTGATVMDPGNWHRNTWEYFILGTLLRDLKAELDEIVRDALRLDQPSLEDLDKVWTEVQLWREQLDELPVTPNLVDRVSERFEGRKRSSQIRLWRAIRRSLKRALRTRDSTTGEIGVGQKVAPNLDKSVS